jgi:Carboxypeptidase regulatory-like domain
MTARGACVLAQVAILLGLASGTASAQQQPQPPSPSPSPQQSQVIELSGRVVDLHHGGPVEGAQVHVIGDDGDERVEITDRAGHYRIAITPGSYEIAFVFGTSRTTAKLVVPAGAPATTLDGKVDSKSGEVIEIVDKQSHYVMPVPRDFRSSRAPPYSDEAIDKDAWVRAWLLLDISATGEVTRFKFLKRPGYQLEKIAADEAFRLSFEPARDAHGAPTRMWFVWLIEWPSYFWLRAGGTNLPTQMPPRSAFRNVPCKGNGPWRMGSIRYNGFRDCSEPDMARMHHEPWVIKPVPAKH